MINQLNPQAVTSVTLRYYAAESPFNPIGPTIKDRLSNLRFMLANQPKLILISVVWVLYNSLMGALTLFTALCYFLIDWLKYSIYMIMPAVIIATYFTRDIQNLKGTFVAILTYTILLGFTMTIVNVFTFRRDRYDELITSVFENLSFNRFPIMTFWEFKDNQFKAHNIYANPLDWDEQGYVSKTDFVLNSNHDLLEDNDKQLMDAWRNKLLKLNRDANSRLWQEYLLNEHSVTEFIGTTILV